MVNVESVGYRNFRQFQFTAGSATALIVSGAGGEMFERVEITHMTGSPAYVRLTNNNALTPYNANTASGTELLMTSGQTFNADLHTFVQFIGSTGSPIGASASTLNVKGYY